jgi:hypothetical protein
MAGLEAPIEAPPSAVDLPPTDVVAGIVAPADGSVNPGVLRAACLSLDKYFSQISGLIVVSGATAEIPDVVLEFPDCRILVLPPATGALCVFPFPFHGTPWKALALRSLLGVAARVGARACAVVQGNVRTVTPEWFELLLRPVLLGGYDWVAPRYHRHKYDGAITHGLAYPLMRALYGLQLREPLAWEFGVSARLMQRLLAEDDWNRPPVRLTPGLWMTTVALSEGYRVCQSYLGARHGTLPAPEGGLAVMLSQIADTLFRLADDYAPVWQARNGSRPADCFGHRFDLALDPLPRRVDGMLAAFRTACEEVEEVWSEALRPDTLQAVRQTAARAGSQLFRFEDELWTRIVYEFAGAHHRQPGRRAWLLPSLTPLYLGWLASFILGTEYSVSAEVEEKVESLCQCFERYKPYLMGLWTGSEGPAASPPSGEHVPSPSSVEV